MKQKHIKSLLLSVGIVAALVLTAHADLLLEADTPFFEDPGILKPDPNGTAPWLSALFVQDGNNVNLTLTNLTTNDNSIDSVYLNYDWSAATSAGKPAFPGLLSWSSLDTVVNNITIGPDSAFKPDGTGGRFDIEIDIAPPGNKFTSGESIDIVFSNATVEYFDEFSLAQNGDLSIHRIAAHVKEIIPGDGSTWIGDGGNPIPEPTTMLLFGTGLAGLTGVLRRKRK